ncbi:ABC transporter permease [Psychrobacillus lasiicapitis]|uniref:FtsX-like permease family protein n=1 Tax=Psychrobacillus lasiicapitis TaxID=1636719 RepID=A0A544SSG2_9BACI|nr:ABC transporter permease [Psychrobacillus lasiicapitis]TQR08154.1 FtsX-like permease family protein [Psychrobacillus lasiicapitis]GGA49367.1 ABC transporter permease [Psychrobacillus lasiicapitis]
MTLFSLARKNIARNFSKYFLYIASMVFSIVIYFTFVTLKYSDTIAKKTASSQKLDSLMSGAAVILLLFVAIFIAYSNSFFMKKRKKEVALYALLGVRNRQIGLMLFFENLLLGLFSLVIGVILGFLCSKGFMTILIHLMGYDVIAPFTFSSSAALNTAIVFLAIFLVTSFQGYRLIYQFKLIDLFHASKKGEVVPKPSMVVAILGVLLISIGYWLALQDIFSSKVWLAVGFLIIALIILTTVIVGTFLLFHSVTGFVLVVMKRNEKWLWRGLHLMTISQLVYRIRGNARTLTVIAILSATTVTAGGAVYGLYYNINDQVITADPNTFMYEQTDSKFDQQVSSVLPNVKYDENIEALSVTFHTEQLNSAFNNSDKRIYTIINEKTYNQLATIQKKEKIDVNNANAVILDIGYDERFSPKYKGKTILTEDNTILTFQSFQTQSVLNTGTAGITVVVSNEYYKVLKEDGEVLNYRVIGVDKASAELSEKVAKYLPEKAQLSSAPQDLQTGIESVGSLLFIGGFLGLVFLAATGSIIYFKVLTEAEEDKYQYNMLHKMGVSAKEMRKTIASQVFVIFFVPLAVGLLHSAIALKAFSSLLMMDLVKPVLIWMIAYTVIYGLYYILTVFSYGRIITQNNRTEG